MSNIVRQVTKVLPTDEGDIQRLTLVTLKRPIIQWHGRSGFDPQNRNSLKKTRHFVVSTVILCKSGILNGPFFESMAFAGHTTKTFHPWMGGVSLGEARFYPKSVGWDATRMMEEIQKQEQRIIRQVAKGSESAASASWRYRRTASKE
jgi:hypothetical protein